jgi:hypothetical protein
MSKKDEREAFKQVALKMSKYRLRRALNKAGCDPQEVREAEVEGEDRLVEVLLTKYDENDIDLPNLERAMGKSAGSPKKTEEPKRAAKRSAKKEDDDDDDPYSDAFDDDDDPKDGPDDSEHDDVVEDDEAEPPRKASKSKRKVGGGDGGTDLEALETKIDTVMDLLVSNVEATVELSDKFDAFTNQHIEFEEIMKFAFSRIWKLGAANPLKPGFGDVISKSKEIAAKRIGKDD